ncbi:AAA family ATPase [Stenotrophomonas sp.]|uniref:AAA family ATPase n=1 Tax=Stenotrophomonas sp. TaxID=69392 RepID=UPI00289F4689|nr:AAA family ATPase [Stenotrophomonas sp.]
MFKSLRLEGWRQFDHIEIDLHPRLTVITGSNGAGKSSLLRIFSRNFGFDRPYISTPRFVDGKFQYSEGMLSRWLGNLGRLISRSGDNQTIGELKFADGGVSSLSVPNGSGAQYHLQSSYATSVAGVHIDSHHAVLSYQSVGSIPAHLTTPEQVLTHYNNEVRNFYSGHYSGVSPIYRMKESIISMVIFGEKTSRASGNPVLTAALDGFIEVLRKILPPSLGFLDLEVRQNEIVIRTKTGAFMLDAASGGIATIFDIGWQLHMIGLGNPSFVVTMDEPENHLHPSMQRSLLSRLLDAFPKAQFIVATHSPFIVSSVRDSNVYVLRYREGSRSDGEIVPETASSRVYSERLDTVNRAASANQILRDVLGVEATIPEWVVDEVQRIVAKYEVEELSLDVLARLRSDLAELGYEDQYPAALAGLVGKRD